MQTEEVDIKSILISKMTLRSQNPSTLGSEWLVQQRELSQIYISTPL